MTTLVLDEETAKMPLGEVLRMAADAHVRIMDSSGRPIAQLVSLADPIKSTPRSMIEKPIDLDDPEELTEIRRRARTSREGDLTTPELLDRLSRLSAE